MRDIIRFLPAFASIFFLAFGASAQSDSAEEADIYQRKLVVEEWTGTWCGMCVRGIVGMEYMEEKYGNENFIGLCVHCDDIMEAPDYKGFIDKYANLSSFPGSTVNRRYVVDPSKESLEKYYRQITEIPTYARISVAAVMPSEGDDRLEVRAVADFSRSFDDADFRVAFVMTEDEVGPYPQMNLYSTGYLGPLDGWEKLPNRVSVKFNKVVRASADCLGAEGSMPRRIEAGNSYEWNATVNLEKIKNLNRCTLSALLIDGTNGEVINGDRIEIREAGIELLPAADRVALKVNGNTLRIEGEYEVCRIYRTDGTPVAMLNGEEEITLSKGFYVVSLTDTHSKTVTRKIII